MVDLVLKRPVTVLMFYISVLGLSIFSLMNLNIELTPEVDFPRLSVVTRWYGASSELIENRITTAVEEVATTVNGVRKIWSTSSEGTSIVNVEFQRGIDLDFARLELSEKLSNLYRSLPEGVEYPVIQKYVPEVFRELQGFMSFNIYGDLPFEKIQGFAEEEIKPAVLSVRGVSGVRVLGGAERQILFILDGKKLESLGLDVLSVIRAVSETQIFKPSGRMDLGGELHFVCTGERIEDIRELENVPVRFNGGVLKIRDIGRVIDTLSERRSIVRINGKPSITLEIDREPGVNMLKLSKMVERKIDEVLRKSDGRIYAVKISDKSNDIRMEVSELGGKAIISSIFIIFVVFVFLGDIISAIVVFAGVIFSVAGALIFLYATGIGLNILTLSALALSFGVIIDNSIVIFENVRRNIDESGGDLVNLKEVIVSSVDEMRKPLLASTLTTVGALFPVIFLPKDLKPYFIQFAYTSSFLLLFSFVVSITFVPVVSAKLYSRFRSVRGRGYGSVFSVVILFYRRVLEWCLRHRRLVVLLSFWIIGFPFWLLPEKIEISDDGDDLRAKVRGTIADVYNLTFGSSFYRENLKRFVDYGLGGATHLFFKHVYKGELWKWGSETYLVVGISAPQGTEIERVDEFVRKIESALEPNFKFVKLVTSRITNRFASVRIDFDEKTSMTAAPYIIKENLITLCAQTSGFTTYVSGFGPGFYSGGGAIVSFSVQVEGYNYDKVKEIAWEFAQIISKNPRVDEIEIDRAGWMAQKDYEIVGYVNREKLNEYNIPLVDFLRAMAVKLRFTELAGTRLKIAGRELRAGFGFERREDSVDDLLNSVILVSGKSVRVGDFIELKLQPVMPEILRENQQYVRYITFNFKGPYRYGVKFTDAVIKGMKLPPGYEIKRTSFFFLSFEKQEIPLVLIAFVAVLIIFMVTASLYESLLKPFVIILSIPLSLSGMFFTFYLFDLNFGRGGYSALMFLIGLCVNTGIILVDKISSVEIGAYSSREERIKLISLASSLRLRPILITTLTTVAGFFPFIIGANIFSFWYAFSIAITGGLIFSTLIVLFVLPVFYFIITKKKI